MREGPNKWVPPGIARYTDGRALATAFRCRSCGTPALAATGGAQDSFRRRDVAWTSSVPRQLAASPVFFLARSFEHPIDVRIERPHHAFAREHRGTAVRHHQHQGFDCRLPFRRLMNGPRKLGDVSSGVFEHDELAAARQRDRFVECAFPAGISHRRAAMVVSSPATCARLDRNSGTFPP
jgi:hypothetical protein